MLEDILAHPEWMAVQHADLQLLGHELIRLVYIHWLRDRLWKTQTALNSNTACSIFQNHQKQNVCFQIIIITDHSCSAGSTTHWTSWTSLGCCSLLHAAPRGTQSGSQLSDTMRRNNMRFTEWQTSKDKHAKMADIKKNKIQIVRYSDGDIKGMAQWKTARFTQDIITQPWHCVSGPMALTWLLQCPKLDRRSPKLLKAPHWTENAPFCPMPHAR